MGSQSGLPLENIEQEQPLAAAGGPGARLPRHVAVIMDGNGRWAHARSMPRSAGHRQGVQAVRRCVASALELGIPYLTIFSFSAENWSRPEGEISYLLGLLRRFIRQDVADLHAKGVRVRVIGDRQNLSRDILALIEDCERLTAGNTNLTLIVAFNYGGRQEIASAVRQIAEKVANGNIEPGQITPETISAHLFAPDAPEPDLLIRTSGEMRISNFLLWQMAYTEFVFVDEHWPDFNHETFLKALRVYNGRERRFGGVATG